MCKINKRESELLFQQVASHCQALKNWLATAVESEEFERATRLVIELREYQSLYSKLNGFNKYGDN
jgi:hypothetical protein